MGEAKRRAEQEAAEEKAYVLELVEEIRAREAMIRESLGPALDAGQDDPLLYRRAQELARTTYIAETRDLLVELVAMNQEALAQFAVAPDAVAGDLPPPTGDLDDPLGPPDELPPFPRPRKL